MNAEDTRRMDAMVNAIVHFEARGFNVVNVKVPRSFFNRVRADFPYASIPDEPKTFMGYPIKVVED